MFCEKCGNQIVNGHSFCTKCGAPVRMVGSIPHAATASKLVKHPIGARVQRAQVKKQGSLKKFAVIVGAIIMLILVANASLDALTKTKLNELRGTWQVVGYSDSEGNITGKNDLLGLLAAMADGYLGTDIIADSYYGQFASISVGKNEIDLQPLGYGIYETNEFWYAGEKDNSTYDNTAYFLEKWNIDSGMEIIYAPDTEFGQTLVVGNSHDGIYYILTRK